jgi:Xaa-Pro aminopeptidase
MITSIEPGIYRPGKWGIRIENLVLAGGRQTEFGEFLGFRDADPVPDRHPLHRARAAARRRKALAQRLSRDGAQAAAAAALGDALAWLENRTVAI